MIDNLISSLLCVGVFAVIYSVMVYSNRGEASPAINIFSMLFTASTFCLGIALLTYNLILRSSISNLQIFKPSLSLFFSILGIWLGVAGVIGKKRLRNWGISLDGLSYDVIDNKVGDISNFLLKKVSIFSFVVFLLFVFVGNFSYIFFPQVMENIPRSISQPILEIIFFTLLFLLLFLAAMHSPIVRFVFFIPILLVFFLPFKIVSLIEKEENLERTLLFVGAILTTIGIVLLFKP